MKIDNFKVYDFAESIVASGLPMAAEYDAEDFELASSNLGNPRNGENVVLKNDHFLRARRLAINPPGTGHNNFLSGILVAANVTASNAWWLQFGRYHFAQIVSSQSKMHRIRKMIDGGKFPFEYMDKKLFDAFKEVAADKNCSDEGLIMQTPLGLQLTARITTNYLQLKTIYRQRRNHRLLEWQDFCDWIKDLPFAWELICAEPESKPPEAGQKFTNEQTAAMIQELRRLRDCMRAGAMDMQLGRVYRGKTKQDGFNMQAEIIENFLRVIGAEA